LVAHAALQHRPATMRARPCRTRASASSSGWPPCTGSKAASLCDLHFLIGLRADMLRWHKRVPGLRALDDDLEALFSGRRPVAQGARAVLRHDGE
jgi:hypothetical protein